LQEVASIVGDVSDFDRRVAPDLVLEHQVVLPVVRRSLVHLSAALRRAERRAEAAVTWLRCGIELTNAVQRAHKGRVRGNAEDGAEPFALEELADAGAERCLPVPGSVPRHAEARSEVV